jgi:outer membrane protein assembly factor BamB
VYALDAATGARRWTAITGVSVSDSPTVADGMVYAIGGDLKVYALDAGTGATVWTAVFGPQPSGGGPVFCGPNPSAPSAPAVAGGVVYVAGWCDGTVHAFDATSGATVWTLSGRFGISAPALANGTLYVVSEAGLQALDAATGATVWTVSTPATDPVLANGVLYHARGGGVLVARDPATGAQLWSDATAPGGRSANAYLSVAVANGAVYAARDLGAVSAHHP